VHLKGLRLKGFKSFPKPTALLFEPGVGVIIGPNGSGKSNLSDAVIWALGEQSPTSLRGSSMQDVIFAGSDGRRALASAEVELTFDNADGALPLPTPEVSVMRRVTRDGSSQYFVNHSSCRLTDVVELLAPVGLGRETHSIIGQGKVEAFLVGKPEDRRNQIEEAAGLGAYKRRRERAELKLREVGRNLERLALLDREVGGQLAPLRRQANALGQLRSIETELGEARGRLLTGAVAALDEESRSARRELDGIEAARSRCDEELAHIAAARAGEEEAFARRLAERERRAQRLLRVRMLDNRLDSARRLTEQRLRLLEEIERAANAERERLRHELAGAAEEPEDDAWPSQEERLVKQLEEAAAAHAEVTVRLEAARRSLSERRSVLSGLVLERENALATVARLERRQESLAGEEARISRRQTLLLREGGDKAELERAAVESETIARQSLTEAALKAQVAADEARAAGQALSEAEEQHGAAGRELRALESEVQHLNAALLDLQDVDGEVLGIADGYPGTASMAAAVSCAAGYEKALAAALSQASGSLAVPADVDHWSLLHALKSAGVGLVRLVIGVPGVARTLTFPGAVPLLDKVDVGGRDELKSALGDVVLVDDLRAVPESFLGLAVTREGEFYRPSTGYVGLAGGVAAALLFERRAALQRLGEKLDDLRAREARDAAVLELARRREAASRAERDACTAAERSARIEAEKAERELAILRGRRRDLEAASARETRALEALADERAEAAAAAGSAEQQAASLLLQSEQVRPDVDAAEAEVRLLDAQYNESQAVVMRRRVELEERRAAAARAAAQRAAARQRLAAGRERLVELEQQLSASPGLRQVCEMLAARVAGLQAHASRLIAQLGEGEETSPDLDRGALRALAEKEAKLRREHDDAGERRMAVQVALTRVEDRRADLAASLAEVSEQLDRAGFSVPSDDIEAQELRAKVDRLTRRRERIGPVNALAEAECAELEERAAFLREQRRDLERSVHDLEELIRELTGQIDAEFSETFRAVQEHFVHMVSVLFPGGRGSLELTEPAEENELGGVALHVKPAKKLGQRLQLLSGGERALVGIAFLMALVLARPSPLYILDEVEAALDDVNIGRLVQLLRDYRERTQFIVITHQKRTMDAADVLYGVTMGPDGASQVVSARMAEAEIERTERSRGPAGSTPMAAEPA
jgi:chromosome segregation protein